MSWEDAERRLDTTRPEDIVILLNLVRFGELIGRVASEYARLAELPTFDPNDEIARHLVVDAWRYVCHMADREVFTKSVAADIETLGEQPTQHLPEFGGAAQLPHDKAPDALNRRLEPPV